MLIQRRKEMYDEMEVDMRQTHSRYIALWPMYGSWDPHLDTAYITVLNSLAAARTNIDIMGDFPNYLLHLAQWRMSDLSTRIVDLPCSYDRVFKNMLVGVDLCKLGFDV